MGDRDAFPNFCVNYDHPMRREQAIREQHTDLKALIDKRVEEATAEDGDARFDADYEWVMPGIAEVWDEYVENLERQK